MRIALAVFLALHGLAHLVSFVEARRLVPDGLPHKTTVLAGRVDLGDAGIRVAGIRVAGIRVAGVLWLFVALTFAATAVGAIVDTSWWMPLALGGAVVSLMLSSTELPEARAGVLIDLAILGILPLAHGLRLV